jgi:hypothetical protein
MIELVRLPVDGVFHLQLNYFHVWDRDRTLQMRRKMKTTASKPKTCIFCAIVSLASIMIFLTAGCKERSNDTWGSEYGNEVVREAIRDEMIRNGSDPLAAEIYTKDKYEAEKARRSGGH